MPIGDCGIDESNADGVGGSSLRIAGDVANAAVAADRAEQQLHLVGSMQ